MKYENIYTQENLNSLLSHDKEQGKLYWKPRKGGFFCSSSRINQWNSRFAGKEAFNVEHSEGYFYGSISKIKNYAHRVIWIMEFGYDPIQIDHIDKNRKNNLLTNLRNVTDAENKKNMSMRVNNKSGVTGVHRHSTMNKWTAQIYINKKAVHLGLFENFEDAVSARLIAEKENGYHKNHGKKNDF